MSDTTYNYGPKNIKISQIIIGEEETRLKMDFQWNVASSWRNSSFLISNKLLFEFFGSEWPSVDHPFIRENVYFKLGTRTCLDGPARILEFWQQNSPDSLIKYWMDDRTIIINNVNEIAELEKEDKKEEEEIRYEAFHYNMDVEIAAMFFNKKMVQLKTYIKRNDQKESYRDPFTYHINRSLLKELLNNTDLEKIMLENESEWLKIRDNEWKMPPLNFNFYYNLHIHDSYLYGQHQEHIFFMFKTIPLTSINFRLEYIKTQDIFVITGFKREEGAKDWCI